MVLGGVGLAVTAGKPVVNGDYKDYEGYKGNWTYLLAAGAFMMILGSLMSISTFL